MSIPYVHMWAVEILQWLWHYSADWKNDIKSHKVQQSASKDSGVHER